jgi:predicted Zn-dependent peptidase
MRKNFLLSSLLIVILISIGLPSLAIEFSKGTIKVTQLTLDNGLTVILNEDSSKPEVFGVVAVRAGGKNDPSDATGLAHYMEHMLFKGTQNLGTIDWEKEKPHIDKIFELYDELGKAKSEVERALIQSRINEESLKASEYAIPNELSNLINALGGTNLNAGTGPDNTVYYNKFPSSQIYKWIDLYANRFINPVFRSFQAELEVVYEEKNMYSDQFQSKLLEDFQKVFFKNHPYGQQPLIGTIDHLKNPSLKRMQEFYTNYYVANNMVLVLSGDFVTSEIINDIKEKFGKLPVGKIPQTPQWKEEPFKGREFFEARLTPIKIGILGFRTVTKHHPDYVALEVAMGILNNKNQTGLLDRLTIDGKVLAAQTIALPYNDHGATIILMVPKIVGQKTLTAEELVLSEIKRLTTGEFDGWMVDAIKNSIYVDFQKSIENIESRATFFADVFTSGQTIDEALNYSDRIMSITKEDIVRVSKTYFGDNYLAFHSQMGFPKKEKIEKPGFKPLLSNTNAKSQYAKHFEALPKRETKFVPIDFDKDIVCRSISKGIDLLYVPNQQNNIFSLSIQFLVGNHHIKLLDKATELMGLAGTVNFRVDELKKEFAKIGCSYSVSSDISFATIRVEGIEENLSRSLELINELLTAPVLDQSKLKVMVEAEKADRKMEKSEPDNVASALFEYIRFADKSKSIDRPTLKELSLLQADQLTAAFLAATKHAANLHYVGSLSPDIIQTLLSAKLTFTTNPKVVETPVILPSRVFTENTVFFVDKKKARQSKIFLFANGNEFNIEKAAYIEAFNEYFGGGFSGLVLQEIREYRSLAYGAGGTFNTPQKQGKPFDFIGYVATQADKSIIALETFNGLIRTMPQKPERLEMIKDYLSLSAET